MPEMESSVDLNNNMLSKRRIIKSLLVVSIATAVQFSVYGSSVDLLSSIRIKNSLGNNSQVILYACFIIGNFTIASLCVKLFGLKNCIGVGIILYGFSMVGNFKPTLPVFAVSNVINGFAASVYWISVSCYTMQLATNYAQSDGVDSAKFIFMGIFITFFSSSTIWGNLVSYVMLQEDRLNASKPEVNVSEICGAYFCDWFATGPEDILQTPSETQIIKMSALFLGCAIVAGISVLILADPVKTPNEINKTKVKEMFMATVNCFKDKRHHLLGFVNFTMGITSCFFNTDFTKAFISCTWGVSNIGFVMLVGGIGHTVCAVCFGFGATKLHRSIFIIPSFFIIFGCVAAMGFWTPVSDSRNFVFPISVVWSIVAVVLNVQVRALYAIVFSGNLEAAFAAMTTYNSLGFLIAYAYDSHLCVYTKLIILAVFNLISVVCYIWAELIHKKTRNSDNSYNLQVIGTNENLHYPRERYEIKQK